MNRFSYERPRLAWIKRRARCLLRNFCTTRRTAIQIAADDYVGFVGQATGGPR